jgi:hypothetical protein
LEDAVSRLFSNVPDELPDESRALDDDFIEFWPALWG